MYTNLPAATKTRKKESLPKDLKKIADELIANKFDVKEEVVERKAPDPFPCFDKYGIKSRSDDYPPYDGYRMRQQRYRDKITVQIQPWSRRRVAKLKVDRPSFHCIVEAKERLMRENIRFDMRLIMDRAFLLEFLHKERRAYEYFLPLNERPRDGLEKVVGKVIDINVVLNPNIRGCVLEASF